MGIASIYRDLSTQTARYTEKPGPHSLKDDCIVRLCHAALIPLNLGKDLLSGVAAIPLAGLSLIPFVGSAARLDEASLDMLNATGSVVAHAFKSGLSVLNPNAFTSTNESSLIVEFDRHEGILTQFTRRKVAPLSLKFKGSTNFFLREVAARLIVPIRIITLAARILDLGIGILAVPLAVVYGGTVPNLNNLAYRSLLLPLAVRDVYRVALLVLNPYRS